MFFPRPSTPSPLVPFSSTVHRPSTPSPSTKFAPPRSPPTLAMTLLATPPRPVNHAYSPSRAKRLLENTLRKHEARRATSPSRSSRGSIHDLPDDSDDDLFHSIYSTQRMHCPLASYVRNGHRSPSPSFSVSSRSRHSDSLSSPHSREKLDDVPPVVFNTPSRDAVLATPPRRGREAGLSSVESSAGSPIPSLLSLSNSGPESEHTHPTTPEHLPVTLSPKEERFSPHIQRSPAHPPRAPPNSPSSPRLPGSPSTPASPHTHTPPTDSPTFDATEALRACREVSGYVSFSSVQGLGVPPSEQPDARWTVNVGGHVVDLSIVGRRWR